MRVGFIGLGRMGQGMVRNLLRAGHEVTVWNRTSEAAQALAGDGAKVAASASEACGAEVLITMLADDHALEAVVLPDGRLLTAGRPVTAHLAMGTHGLATAEQLAAAHQAAGQAYVAAPVFGRPEAAAAAKLFILAAGPRDAVERCRPLLDAMGQRVFDLGERPADANLVKLCGNFLIASVIEGLAETMALCRKAGVAPADLLDVLTNTLFTAPVYKTYGGLMVEERFSPPGFSMPLALKDIRLALAAGDRLGVPLPVGSLLRDILLSGIGRGLGELDWSALARVAAENAGAR